MRGDEESAAGEGDGDLCGVGREAVSEPGADADAGEAGEKQPEDAEAAMEAEAAQKRDCAENGDADGESAVSALLTGEQMREGRAGGEKDGGEQAMDEAEGGGGDAEGVGGEADGAAGESWHALIIMDS